MEWTKENLRELRLRLGLCQSDMARHLALDLSTFFALEEGKVEIDQSFYGILELLVKQADQYSDTIRNFSRLDSMFKDHPLDQVDFIDLLQSN